MSIDNISIFSIFTLLIFFVPILLINYKLKLSLNKGIIYGIIRMTLQLGFVGLYLKYIFRFNNIFINLAYISLMLTIACFSIIKSSKLKLKQFIVPTIISLGLPQFIVLFFFNGFVSKITNLFDAKFMITIGGMLLGNSLRANIVVLNSFYNSIKNNNKEYIYSLSLGATRFTAMKPYLREAFLQAISPTVATMATIGLVSLPGMMTGQILGGAIPTTAIKYQIAIMLAIFIVIYFSILLSILLSQKIAFNQYDMLKEDKIFR